MYNVKIYLFCTIYLDKMKKIYDNIYEWTFILHHLFRQNKLIYDDIYECTVNNVNYR